MKFQILYKGDLANRTAASRLLLPSFCSVQNSECHESLLLKPLTCNYFTCMSLVFSQAGEWSIFSCCFFNFQEIKETCIKFPHKAPTQNTRFPLGFVMYLQHLLYKHLHTHAHSTPTDFNTSFVSISIV